MNRAIKLLGFDIFCRAKSERIGAALRRQIKLRLETTPDIQGASVARLVFDTTLDGVDRAVDANRQLESKANGVVVLCIAIIGFGANLWKDNGSINHPFLTAAILLVLVSAIICALRVGSVQTYDLPSPVVYNLASIVNEPTNEAKILVEFTESLSSYARDERNAGITKGKWLFCATRLLLLGLALFAVLAWASIYADRPPKQHGVGAAQLAPAEASSSCRKQTQGTARPLSKMHSSSIQ